jgi:antibiotic biosynthesis monooxygenase (ABM) superfamily enzyme
MTLVEGRTIKPGHENDFYVWIHRTLAVSERFPGSQGVTILTLGQGPSAVRYVIHRFADETTGLAWVNSQERAALIHEASAFSTPYTETVSGPEAWFTLPEMSDTAPPKWKLFLTTIPSAYIASLVIVLFIEAFLHGWPLLVTDGMVTVFLAFMLTYVGLPLSTHILRSWLYPQQKRST